MLPPLNKDAWHAAASPPLDMKVANNFVKGKKINIPTLLVTRENSKIVQQRAKKIQVMLYMNIKDKKSLLPKICRKYKVELKNIAYIGDDVNDIEIMKQVGLTAAPHDAMNEIKTISDYVCTLRGGEGSFREFANLIINAHSN